MKESLLFLLAVFVLLSLIGIGCAGKHRAAAPSETGPEIERREAIWEAARQRGANFRAVGNEPGWHLEIHPDGASVFVADYGEKRVEFKTPKPQLDRQARRTTYRAQADGQEIVIILENRTYPDTMSGEKFPMSATVLFDGRKYEGGGRSLR